MSQHVGTSLRPAALSTEQVRLILNRWSRESFFRIANFGERVSIESIRAHSSYTTRLWSEYEERSSERVTVPYQGGYVDDNGRPPELWTIPVRRPSDFEDRTDKLPVPHTERVQTCSGCTGVGTVSCSQCQGWGKVTCPQCQGRGYRERSVMQPAVGQPGFPQRPLGEATPLPPQPALPPTQLVREPCQCFGGKVNCTPCQGRGKTTCGSCSGSGRVKTFEQLTVRFSVKDRSEVINTTQVPAEQMRAASGAVLIEERGPRIDTFAPVTPEVDRAAHALLSQSHGTDPGAARLLFQRLQIKQVSVHEVEYRFGSGTARQLWIYGDDEKVHAPDAPWAWWRLAVILGGIAAVVLGIIFLVASFAR